MSVISDIKMILENANAMCITDAKTYTEQKARFRDAKNYVCEMECVRADVIREFADGMINMMPGHKQDIEQIAEQLKSKN